MATGYLDPNGQVSNDGWLDESFANSSNVYTSVDDAAREPTTPNVADYIYGSGGQAVVFSMPTLLGVTSASQVKVWVYADTYDWGGSAEGLLVSAKLGGSFQTDQRLFAGGTFGSSAWASATFSGSFTQSDIDNLELRLTAEDAGFFGNEYYVFAVYVEVTYTQAAATGVLISGPAAGVVNMASASFTIQLNGTHAGVTVTPNDSGDGGSFSPPTVALSTGTPSATVTYTAASSGAKTITTTNNASLSDLSSFGYTAYDPPGGVSSGLKRWYNADVLSGTNGDSVSTWPDLCAASDATQGSSSAQPTFQNSAFNSSYKCVVFDGNDYLSLTGPTMDDFTVIVVMDVTVGYVYGQGSAQVQRQGIHLGHRSSTQATLALFADDFDVSTTVSGVHVNSYRLNASNVSEIRVNQVSLGTHTHGGLFTGNTAARIGNDVFAATVWLNGKVAQLLIYDRPLSDTERADVEYALMQQYGLVGPGMPGGGFWGFFDLD